MKTLALRGALAEHVIARAADIAPDPLRKRKKQTGAAFDSLEYLQRYAMEQFRQRMRIGLGLDGPLPDLLGKDVIELGCGHGGISAFLGCLGARSVLGVDLNEIHLAVARELTRSLDDAGASGLSTRVGFREMDVHHLDVPDESIDIIFADNLFEHVDDPAQVLRESHRVLRPGGTVVAPTFSSIWSKWGLHLKLGLKLPWLNLLFDEPTIVAALQRRARRDPALYEAYPGLRDAPTRVRDVRRHRDLNHLTHTSFIEMATTTGFDISGFQIHLTPVGRVLGKLITPLPRREMFDVLSTGAGAVLTKVAR